LGCSKSVCRCGAKRVSKKHLNAGELLEVVLFKKCTRLTRKYVGKHTTFGPLLDVQTSLFVARAMDSAPWKSEPNVKVLQQFQKQWQVWDI